MVVFCVRAEKNHAALVFGDDRQSQHLLEKPPRALHVFGPQHEMPYALDGEAHDRGFPLRMWLSRTHYAPDVCGHGRHTYSVRGS
jgi:hypothetical protein